MTSNQKPEMVLRVMNSLLKEVHFPREWKTARLVLIPKPGKPAGSAGSYRPLCMIDTWGKMLEGRLARRLWEEIDASGCISDNQHGFRPGRSPVTAARQLLGVENKERSKTLRTRNHVLMIPLDARNAFGSASWKEILGELVRRGVTPAMRKIVQSYLHDRRMTRERCAE